MNNPFFITLSLTGAIFTIAGIVMLKFPPKKINGLYGYRTPRSMKTQENWDFAQVYSAKEMIKAGILMMLGSTTGLWYNPDTGISTISAIVLLIGTVVVLIVRVERAINRQLKRI